MKIYRTILHCALMTASVIVVTSCGDDEYEVPGEITAPANDCLKRSLGTNMVGGTIDFAYAMALPDDGSHWEEAQVEASYTGAEGTFLENKSYHTNAGYDEGVEIGSACVHVDNITKVVFTRDTCAATLRYTYVVPEEARGKQVSFKFSAKSSKGQVVSYKMGPYDVSRMDMVLDIALKNKNCFSISDMRVLTAEEAASNPEKIDFVYTYQIVRGVNFKHAFVSPTEANREEYLRGIALPDGAFNSTKMVRTYGSCDQLLARDENAVFVDDIDMEKKQFIESPDYLINVLQKGGAWMETHDGKYRAYIYVNTAPDNKAGMTISMKRMRMF